MFPGGPADNTHSLNSNKIDTESYKAPVKSLRIFPFALTTLSFQVGTPREATPIGACALAEF